MTEAIISGLLLGLALVFTVGPVLFTILKLRINYGLVSAFYFIAGVWLSDTLWILTANLFSGLLGKLISYRMIIGWAGGILLIALGVYYLFFKKFKTKAELDQGVKIGSATHAKLFITGYLINTLNPGVIALWFAATTKTLDNNVKERVATFVVCLGVVMAADVLKIYLAGRLRNKLNDHNIRLLNKVAGILYLVFGVALIIGVLYTGIKH
ncbi:MAG: LysE family transporter [Ferruginibacter sp.]